MFCRNVCKGPIPCTNIQKGLATGRQVCRKLELCSSYLMLVLRVKISGTRMALISIGRIKELDTFPFGTSQRVLPGEPALSTFNNAHVLFLSVECVCASESFNSGATQLLQRDFGGLNKEALPTNRLACLIS